MSFELMHLLANYRQQELAYEEVLRLAQEGAEKARSGEALAELQAINLRKRKLLSHVSRLERRAELHKLSWAPSPHATAAGVELESLLTRITHLIDQILRCEHETDLWILQGAARAEARSLRP